MIFAHGDDNQTLDEEYPVFWVTPELFWELTYIDWEWTSFARFEDPQMGRGAYFAFEDSESSPPYYDPVYGEHEILESYDLIHVTELVPVGLPSVWMVVVRIWIFIIPKSLRKPLRVNII